MRHGVRPRPCSEASRHTVQLGFYDIQRPSFMRYYAGVTVDTFFEVRRTKSGHPFLSDQQEAWVTTQRLLATTQPEPRPVPPNGALRRAIYKGAWVRCLVACARLHSRLARAQAACRAHAAAACVNPLTCHACTPGTHPLQRIPPLHGLVGRWRSQPINAYQHGFPPAEFPQWWCTRGSSRWWWSVC